LVFTRTVPAARGYFQRRRRWLHWPFFAGRNLDKKLLVFPNLLLTNELVSLEIRMHCLLQEEFMRAITLIAIIALLAQPAMPASEPAQRTTGQYAKHQLGPKPIAMVGVGATVNQAHNTPREWGQGAAGFGKRFASGLAKHAVNKGIQYPVARALHEELSYRPSGRNGFGPRMKYALMGVVVTHKTNGNRGRTVNGGEISGAVGSGLISRLWQPASTRTVSAAFTSAGVTLGVDAGQNVVREFWPEIRHQYRHGEQKASASKHKS
jgi:hypothetical protein